MLDLPVMDDRRAGAGAGCGTLEHQHLSERVDFLSSYVSMGISSKQILAVRDLDNTFGLLAMSFYTRVQTHNTLLPTLYRLHLS